MKINLWWDSLEKNQRRRVHKDINAFAYTTMDGYISFQLEFDEEINEQLYKRLNFTNIQIFVRNKNLFFVLKTNNFKDVFYYFCLDLLNNLENKPLNTYANIIYNVFDYWKCFFKKNRNNIPEIVQMGLFAELSFLENDSLKNLSLRDNLDSWRGFDGDIQDFIYEKTSVEVKSKLSSKSNEITISSAKQLEHIKENLFLVCYSLDKNIVGKTIKVLIEEIIFKIKTECPTLEVSFIKSLAKLGFNWFDEYDNLIEYIIDKIDSYEINDLFPKLTTKDIPLGITKIEYKVNLDSVEKYKVNQLRGV